MTLEGFLILVLVAAICGIVGQFIAGYSIGGLVISVAVGFAGAWIGLWLAREFELPDFYRLTVDGRSFPVVWSIIGSALLAAVVGLVLRPRYR
jgi:uncharacterized membrane protein YeaQ/YmgE (transglycosylase-associated protein family)